MNLLTVKQVRGHTLVIPTQMGQRPNFSHFNSNGSEATLQSLELKWVRGHTSVTYLKWLKRQRKLKLIYQFIQCLT